MVNVKFENNASKILVQADRKKSKILTAIGLKAVSIWMKIITQKKVVDTGRFRNACKSEVHNDYVIVGNATEYAPYLELGTSRMKARPTLTPAILDYKDSYTKIAKQIWAE